MKIYFVGSISGKDRYLKHYQKIISSLKQLGHEVSEITLEPTKEYVYGMSDEKKVEQYKRVLKWISDADVVVAEGSYSSMGVGYEISLALEKGKPVIVMYEEGQSAHFLEGIESDRLAITKYRIENLDKVLEDALDFSSKQRDTRFNFFISRRLSSYLDWISRKRRIPRAVYLRQLIRKEMQRKREFR